MRFGCAYPNTYYSISVESVSPGVSRSAKMNYKIFTPCQYVPTAYVSRMLWHVSPMQNFYPASTHWNKYNYIGHEGFLGSVPQHATGGTTPHQVHISPTASTTPLSGRFPWKFSPFTLFCVWICLWDYWSQMLWLSDQPPVFRLLQQNSNIRQC